MKQGAHLLRLPTAFRAMRFPQTLQPLRPRGGATAIFGSVSIPPLPCPPHLPEAGLTSCSAMRMAFSWMVSPSARGLLGVWMRFTSLCSHSSRRRRMFFSSERYVLATVSSLSSAGQTHTQQQLKHPQAPLGNICPKQDLLGSPKLSTALC